MLFYGRRDGKKVKGGDPMMHIMPYMMRGRNESAVYLNKSICVENIQKYIQEKRRDGKRVTLFNIIVAAMLHIIYRRPHLNRFVAGRKLYVHNEIDVLYVVKTSMTDEGVESVARVTAEGHDTLEDVTQKMRDHINSIKDGAEKTDDKLIKMVTHFPRFMLRFCVWLLRVLDFHGMLPRTFTNMIPLYSSVFISHIGSLGAEAPFHHLYEFGTTSIFCTIGKIYLKPYRNIVDNSVEWKKTIDLNFTIDERICDGYYLVKSLKLLENYLEHPELLEQTPIEMDLQHKQKIQHLDKGKNAEISELISEYWDHMLDSDDD